MNKIELGKWGERKAEEYLCKYGIIIIDKNYRTHFGELDIIGKDKNQVIFFEVKTRRNESFGFPEESIDTKKQEHLINSAEEYIQTHNELGEDWRIDVIAIQCQPWSQRIDIQWYKNAISD